MGRTSDTYELMLDGVTVRDQAIAMPTVHFARMRRPLGALFIARVVLPWLGALALISSCSTYSTLYPAPTLPGLVETPTGSLRLAQVMAIATRANILSESKLHQSMVASGIADSEIRDGTLAAGRVQCCGGPNEKSNSFVFYVPSDIHVEVGDIVEIKMGRTPNGTDPGILNTVTQIRSKASDHNHACWWDPPTEGLWMRTLYCDWMPAEGWVEKKATIGERTWLKLPRLNRPGFSGESGVP